MNAHFEISINMKMKTGHQNKQKPSHTIYIAFRMCQYNGGSGHMAVAYQCLC